MKESNTTYAYLIEHMQNPSFQKIWDIAYDFVHKLPCELSDELHKSLNRGVDVLDSEPLLQMYIYAFGKMHNAKLQYAFNHMQSRVLDNDKIAIVDWGCGQGLASLCYKDFLKERNSQQQVTQITLIEPSQLALSRAELLCSCFYPNAKIVAVNKHFDELSTDDIEVSLDIYTLHLFSNIIDVELYNLNHLIQIVKDLSCKSNEFIIVSPIQNAIRMQRLKTFATNIHGMYYEKYLDKRQLDRERDWTCAVLLCTSFTMTEIMEYECNKVFEEAHEFHKNNANDKNGAYSIELFHKVQICAELGDKRCQNVLGIFYQEGFGTDMNLQKAFEWYLKSAEQKYISAIYNIGNMFYYGEGVEQDFHKAIECYSIGANENDPDCQFELGLCIFNGICLDKNFNVAFKLFKSAAEQGHELATYYLWKCYINGYGVTKNEKTAVSYLKKAIKFHNPEAYYIMARLCQAGKLVNKDEKKALRLIKKAAELGCNRAQERLGEIYHNGELGEEESPKKSFKWYLKAAENGISSAQFYIGYFYANGYGVKKNTKLSFEWYSNAAEQNNPAALNNLAICYKYGKGTTIDLTKAIYYYEESAKLGNIKAQKNLALCYKMGTGVERSPSKVFYWTLKAAENGDIESMRKIALYYINGYGTNKNKIEALLWYAKYYSKNIHIDNANEAFYFLKKKSDEGDSQALYIVGKCLQYGVATEKNIRNAYICFEKAAELGHIESLIKINRLSSLYKLCSIKEIGNTFNDTNGIKYSNDKKILIDGGCLNGGKYRIAKGTRIICDHALVSGNLEKIIIPSSVVAIGKNPFAKAGWGICNVKEIECHSTHFVISDFALYTKDKKKLISYFGKESKVIIPNGVEVIGENAFVENKNLKHIEFPDSLSTIEDAAFMYCLNLKQISLPKNVRQIGRQCFYGCESLEIILNLGNVEKICKESFCGCDLRNLFLPESLIEIDDNAFNSNRNLEVVSLPTHVKRIGNSSFAFCSIKHVYLNNSLLEIGDFCFYNCPIESIVVPSSINSIGLNPFIGALAIECKDNCRYASESGLLYDKQSGCLISCYGETEVELNPPINSVNSFAFDNSNVTDIFMGSNIVEVSAWAFYNAHKLEKIIWRKSRISEIPMGCFGNCSKIIKIDIPSNVENVSTGAFFNCYNIRTLRFCGVRTTANEEIFRRIERPLGIPSQYCYKHEYELTGSTTTEWYGREVDPNTFIEIEIMIPHGCSDNFSFSPIYDDDIIDLHLNEGYGMDRRFIIKEDEKE